jgi:hypothetical protein
VVADEAELDVERAIFGEVPDSVVRLRSEHRPDLVDPLEDADHLLLVELRALGQVGRAPEVVDGEHVGARLGGRLDELRRGDLGEVQVVERRAEATQRGGGQLPLGALRGMPPQDRGVVEERRQRDVERRAPQLGGRSQGRLGECLDGGVGDLHATGGLWVGGRPPDHANGRLLRRHVRAGGKHHLRETAAVADDEEGHACELAAPVHPAFESDGRAGLGSLQG